MKRSDILNPVMFSEKAVIKNNAGIHVRPSGVIINEMGKYSGKLVIISKQQKVELNSVMSLLSLGLMKDDEVDIEVTGREEEAVCHKLKELLERIYDFPPRK